VRVSSEKLHGPAAQLWRLPPAEPFTLYGA
jgi:hypothetical protein